MVQFESGEGARKFRADELADSAIFFRRQRIDFRMKSERNFCLLASGEARECLVLL
jgi:hypothetical protein